MTKSIVFHLIAGTYLANPENFLSRSGPYLKAAPDVSAKPIEGVFDRIHSSWLHLTFKNKDIINEGRLHESFILSW